MTVNKKIPSLRFKKFEGEWEEKKLGEMCSAFKSGNSITGNDIYETGNFPVYGGNGLRGYTNSYTHDGFYVLIGRQGALCGNINRAIGKTFISEHAIAAQANESSDTEWLAQKLDLMKLNQYSESSAQPGLAVNKLVKLKIISPSLPEQQKIAAFLTAVDDKIQQLTKKKALLEQYKKGVMQQIFNQQIRFKDDDGNDYPDWEEKELGEIGEIVTGSTPSTLMKDYYNGERLFVSPIDIQQSRFINNTVTTLTELGYSKGRCIKKGSILFVCIGSTIGKVAQAGKDLITNQQINSVIPFDAYNNDFIFSTLQFYAPKIRTLAAEQAVPIINKTTFSKVAMHIPNIEEQQKIANFLTGIDNKINAVGRQLEQTQVYKKGLLQQMFV